VVHRHTPAAFSVDWSDGFLLRPFASPNYRFIYAFSQLKGSADDGAARLVLHFLDAGEIVEEVSES